MNGEKFNPGADFNQDDEHNWEKVLGTDRTDELDKINAEEEQEFKDLYPGEYDDQEENVEPTTGENTSAEEAPGEQKAA